MHPHSHLPPHKIIDGVSIYWRLSLISNFEGSVNPGFSCLLKGAALFERTTDQTKMGRPSFNGPRGTKTSRPRGKRTSRRGRQGPRSNPAPADDRTGNSQGARGADDDSLEQGEVEIQLPLGRKYKTPSGEWIHEVGPEEWYNMPRSGSQHPHTRAKLAQTFFKAVLPQIVHDRPDVQEAIQKSQKLDIRELPGQSSMAVDDSATERSEGHTWIFVFQNDCLKKSQAGLAKARQASQSLVKQDASDPPQRIASKGRFARTTYGNQIEEGSIVFDENTNRKDERVGFT